MHKNTKVILEHFLNQTHYFIKRKSKMGLKQRTKRQKVRRRESE